MDLAKSQKIIKVLGVLNIIAAVFCLVVALGLLGVGGLGGMAAADLEAPDPDLATGIAVFLIGGLFMLASGVIDLIEGIFSLRAAKDAAKAKPLWVISIISVVLNAGALINSFSQGSQDIATAVFSLLLSCGVLYLANNIKKNA